MKTRIIIITAALITASSCTGEQLDTFSAWTGQRFDASTRQTLEALPDVEMRIDATHVVTPSGAVELRRERHCDQWRDVMLAAGWSADVFDAWASGVMWRESHCDPFARSRTNDHGLMQINAIVIADMRQRPALWSNAIDAIGRVPSTSDLLDPFVNAIISAELYSIRGRAPWT